MIESRAVPIDLEGSGLAVREDRRSTSPSPAGRTEVLLRVLVVAIVSVTAVGTTEPPSRLPALVAGALVAVWLVGVVVIRAIALVPQSRPTQLGKVPLAQFSASIGLVRAACAGWSAERREGLPPLCRACKRTVDVLMAGSLLIVVLPVLLLAVAAITVETRGSPLFCQTRCGAGGRPFRILKLRTMYAETDDREHRAYVAALIRGDGQRHDGIYKLVDDDRRTMVGRFLRSFSIDELPQLWNVLRGDMSIIGPRPPLPEEASLYDSIAWRRMAMKPGLTGLWQVSGRSRLTFDEMVELDVRYWQEWAPWLDLKILLRTPKAVLWARETA